MRKQELIHLHGLFTEVLKYMDRRTEGDIDTPSYDSAPATPTAIHKSKGDHKEAVSALADDLTAHIEEERETIEATAD